MWNHIWKESLELNLKKTFVFITPLTRTNLKFCQIQNIFSCWISFFLMCTPFTKSQVYEWVYDWCGLNCPHFFGAFIRNKAAAEQHQVRTEEISEQSVPSSGLKFLAWSTVTRFPPCVAKASHCDSSEDDINVYMWACSVTMTVTPY